MAKNSLKMSTMVEPIHLKLFIFLWKENYMGESEQNTVQYMFKKVCIFQRISQYIFHSSILQHIPVYSSNNSKPGLAKTLYLG